MAQNDIPLTQDFASRIEKVPGNRTQLHIPSRLRPRHARIWATTLEGFNEDLPGFSRLEEARSKLLLHTPPQGLHVGHELDMRTRMWEEGRCLDLLGRIESQLMKAQQPTKKQ